MPGQIVRNRGPLAFQRMGLQSVSSAIVPGINIPVGSIGKTEDIVLPKPAVVSIDPVEVKPQRKKPKPKAAATVDPEPSEEEGTEEDEYEEVKHEAIPVVPEVREEPVKKELVDRFLKKEPVASVVVAEKPKRKPRKKAVPVDGVVKPTKELTVWQKFMVEAKNYPEIKALPGKERMTAMSALYQQRKSAAKAPVEELKE